MSVPHLSQRSVRIVATGAVALSMTAMVAACGNRGLNSSAKKNTTQPTIGYTVYDMSSFITLGKQGTEREAQALGAKILWRSANNDVNTQASQIRSFVNQHVDAIVVAAVNSATLGPQIKQANDAGIPVIATNLTLKPPASNEIKSYVGPDDVAAGAQEATAMATKLHGKGRVVLMQGPLGQSGEIDRTKGVKQVLAKNPGIKLLASQPANWDRDKAYTLMSNWMSAFGKIDGVISENDDMAIGSLRALATKGQDKTTAVVGIDGIQDGMNAVKAGRIYESNLQNGPLELGEACAVAVKAVRGQKYPKQALLTMPKITKSNVTSLYNELYTKRDAYLRNLPKLIDSNLTSGQYGRQTLGS